MTDSAAADREALISLRDVSFAYERTPVLLGVNLDLHHGDFLALIGPNGSGKTTLVKLALGLLRPDRGAVFLFGRPIGEFSDWQRIGYVPQKATHFDPLFPASVEEAVRMALRSHGARLKQSRAEAAAAVAAALDLVGLGSFRRLPVGGLSGGQQQRVFIARALATRPDVLVLDEPTTGVDAETRDRFYDMLGRLNAAEGIAIVLVTHDIAAVDRRVNSVACLNQRLIYHGGPDAFCRSAAFQEMLGEGAHVVAHEH